MIARTIFSCLVCGPLLFVHVVGGFGVCVTHHHHQVSGRRPLRLEGWWDRDDGTPLLENGGRGGSSSSVEDEIVSLEKQVLFNAQAELDLQNVNRAVTSALSDSQPTQGRSTLGPQWTIALAGGLSLGSIVFVLTQNILLGLLASLGIGFVASRNPVEEEDPAGAVARTVGRATLASMEAAKPKAKALARAALTGDEEIVALRAQVDDLERRNRSLEEEYVNLSMWKKRREWVDEKLSSFNLQELKEQARENKLQVGGTKTQLLMRLVKAEIINPDPINK